LAHALQFNRADTKEWTELSALIAVTWTILMCFHADNQPPIDPIASAAIIQRSLVLIASDHNRFSAYEARPATPAGAGILILPDARGLNAYYQELGLRFAERGVAALAIDLFGRTAGLGPRDDPFEPTPRVGRTNRASVRMDIAAGVAALRDRRGAAARAVFPIGFCYGGRAALLAATMGLNLAGVIGFYGWPHRRSMGD